MSPTSETVIANALIDAGINEKISVQEAEAFLALSAGEPVAWRWRFDKEGNWHFGVNKPGDFRFGNPEEIEPLYAAPAPLPVAVNAQNPYGHWVKHRLADGAFIPAGCYVPSGPDYTVVPLYTHADDLAIDQFTALREENERLLEALKTQTALMESLLPPNQRG